ncbi:MAG TPA: glycine cleavage system protein GcvH [Actinomycetota bacterium]|nr:glycine cleavage system protein GcvH [Actinomycetota bacterium]
MVSDVPENLRYTSEHEWARPEGDRVVVGITDYAQDQLGDVVFVSLPEPGSEVAAGATFGEVESTKSVSDLYSPVAGTVAERNDALEKEPELINQEPYGRGWLISIDAPGADLGHLLDAAAYKSHIEEA